MVNLILSGHPAFQQAASHHGFASGQKYSMRIDCPPPVGGVRRRPRHGRHAHSRRRESASMPNWGADARVGNRFAHQSRRNHQRLIGVAVTRGRLGLTDGACHMPADSCWSGAVHR
jgi:hypothetical protein